MTNNKTENYWLCIDSLQMKGDTSPAFIEGKKYPQVKPIKNDYLVLRNEFGNEHIITPEGRMEYFEEVINAQ